MIVSKKTNSKKDSYKDETIKNFLKIKNPDKQLMNELIKKIEIDEQKNVKIYFNFNIRESAYEEVVNA